MDRRADYEIGRTDEKTTIEFNDILGGYNDSKKIPNIYKDLMEELKPKKLAARYDNDRLVFLQLPNSRGGSYDWRLMKKDEATLFFEIYGSWEGYAHENSSQPKVDDQKEFRSLSDHFRMGRITIIPPNKKIEEIIMSVLIKYPAHSEKK
ncbi:MAG: hypothetical protein PHU12_02215 [Candidatus Aenigmarchaeota archaeon]|nr:hypothetical protein [Candidatus Aenigmarchaeota archaeon]